MVSRRRFQGGLSALLSIQGFEYYQAVGQAMVIRLTWVGALSSFLTCKSHSRLGARSQQENFASFRQTTVHGESLVGGFLAFNGVFTLPKIR